MKLISVVFVALMAACVKAGPEEMMKIVMGCKTSVGASEEDLAKLMTFSKPENQQQMCLFSCIMGGLNIIKDGKLVKEGVMEMAKQMSNGDAEMMKQAEQIIVECNSLNAADPCEAAVKIGFCLKTEGAKKKMMFNF